MEDSRKPVETPLLHSLARFNWREATDELAAAARRQEQLFPLVRGREAELLVTDPPEIVVKVWTEGNGRAEEQLALLRVLTGRLPAPTGLGWGIDAAGREALAMRHEGMPLAVVGPSEIDRMAVMLARVHATPPPDILRVDGSHDAMLARLFAPDAGEFLAAAREVVATLPPFEKALTHGDFHAANIVAPERGETERLVLVDWSNARISDWRYDVAWAMTLMAIYHSEEVSERLLRTYRESANRAVGDMRPFMSLVVLHWLHLARTAPVPINAEWSERANRLLRRWWPGVVPREFLERLQLPDRR